MANTVTWKDVKTATLKKMFLYESEDSLNDSDNSEYLAAMPEAANEGILMMWSDCPARLQKTVDITGKTMLDLQTEISDIYEVPAIIVYTTDSNGMPQRQANLQLSANRYLLVENGWGSSILVDYMAKPERITTTTQDTYILQCGDDRAQILALYMASQLFKDDNISMATQYRNEFESARSRLAAHPGTIMADMSACLSFD